MSLYDRIMLAEARAEIQTFNGEKGWWVTIDGRHVFISNATGKPVQNIPGVTDKWVKGLDRGPNAPEKEKTALQTTGEAIRDKNEMNVGSTSYAALRKFAEDQFAKAGKKPEDVLPDFDKNLRALQAKMKLAKDIPRIDMPVVEPKDMDDFKKDLEKGAVDIFEPFAKETLAKYGTSLPWERSKKPVTPGSKEAKKLIGLGLPKHDKGKADDDAVKGEFGSTGVKSLKPLQNEIFFKKVLGNIMSFGVPKQGGKLTDDAPIIVSKDGYIIDGHHRFGQAMLADPSLKLKTLTIPLDVDDLVQVTRTYGTAKGNFAKGNKPKK